MSWHNIKVCPADIVFSKLIRLRDRQCLMCGRKGTGDGTGGLQASHFYSRRKWNTRFDPENVDSLCIGCHRKTHQKKDDYEDWKYRQLGEDGFNQLTLRAWNRSPLGSSYWKKLSKKQAEEIFKPMFEGER